MAIQTVNSAPARAGYNITSVGVAADVGGTDSFPNDGNTHVIVQNGNAGSLTITINFPASVTVDGAVPPNKTITVPTGAYDVIGPFPVAQYNDVNNRVTLAWSVTSGVKLYVYKCS